MGPPTGPCDLLAEAVQLDKGSKDELQAEGRGLTGLGGRTGRGAPRPGLAHQRDGSLGMNSTEGRKRAGARWECEGSEACAGWSAAAAPLLGESGTQPDTGQGEPLGT